jgi:isopenicillin N synthase-like dioxygenase
VTTQIFDRGAVAQFQAAGYLRVGINGLTQSKVREVYSAAAKFFQLSLEDKHGDALPFDAGYRPFGIEYSQVPDRPDLMESFSTSYQIEDAGDALRSLPGRRLHRAMRALHDIFETLAEEFIVSLADTMGGLGFGQRFRGALHQWSILQINHNVGLDSSVSYINDLHEDACLISLVSNTGPGLEFQQPDGSFSPITISDSEVVLIPGEILWLLTGGTVKPLYHRVVRPNRIQDRMALLFFADPEPTVCSPWIENDINRNVDIGARIRTNPLLIGLKERAGNSGG